MASAGASGSKSTNASVSSATDVSVLDGFSTNIFRRIDPELKATINMFYVFRTLRKTVVLFTTTDDGFYIFNANATESSESGDASDKIKPIRIPELSNVGVITVTTGIRQAGLLDDSNCDCHSDDIDEKDNDDDEGDTIYDDDWRGNVGYGPDVKVQAVTSNGHVYEWKFDICEAFQSNFTRINEPKLVGEALSEKYVIQASCSFEHSVALSNDGSIYAWGSNRVGQLGTGDFTHRGSPVRVRALTELKSDNIKSILCTASSTFALTQKGFVFAWGRMSPGGYRRDFAVTRRGWRSPERWRDADDTDDDVDDAAGADDANDAEDTAEIPEENRPILFQNLAKHVIVKIACGYDHCLALRDTGHVYHWGCNDYGDLTPNDNESQLLCRIPIGNVTDIAAQGEICAAMNARGIVFVWGNGVGLTSNRPQPTLFTSLHDALVCYSSAAPTSQVVPPSPSFVESFRNAFDNVESSDLQVTVGGKTIHVHKTILQIRSEHYRTMFQGDWKENSNGVIEIKEHSYPVYHAYLKYLYTNEVDAATLAAEELAELYDLANSYFDRDLKQKCSELTKQKLSVDSVASTYEKAILTGQRDLQESCIRFAANNLAAVLQRAPLSRIWQTP